RSALSPHLRPFPTRRSSDLKIPTFALNRMESWAAALSLASAQSSNLGLDANEGVEKKLVAQFGKLKKPIVGLETVEQQLGYFDTDRKSTRLNSSHVKISYAV